MVQIAISWCGEFEGMTYEWLRWMKEDGSLLLTGKESAEIERQRAEAERQRANRFAAKLRELGIDPDTLS